MMFLFFYLVIGFAFGSVLSLDRFGGLGMVFAGMFFWPLILLIALMDRLRKLW